MKQLILLMLLTFSSAVFAQNAVERILNDEHEAGHFNASILVVKDGKVISKLNRGYANMSFAVSISDSTRFPVASLTKTFTAILALQLYEKSLLQLSDKVSKYVSGLPPACESITVSDLLTHQSGLQNEPLAAYNSPYSTSAYVEKFVSKNHEAKPNSFNYNNVDYILLTYVLEKASGKKFRDLLQDNILTPLHLTNTGVLAEATIIPNLAYGYHNYTFGEGTSQDTLYNDPLVYLSNYAGAGAVYSTTEDLYKLVQGLKTNKLLSKKSTALLLNKPHEKAYIPYARGYPTLGFYYNDRTFAKPVLERRGSINGFNSLLLFDQDFSKVIIILANTDTGDLELIGDKLYQAMDELK